LKRIVKGIEPTSLATYRSSIPHTNLENSNIYDDYPHKSKDECKSGNLDNLRLKLLDEQGYICCYCMSRIDCNNSKIEHFKPQSKYRKLQINYSNLFVSCLGNEGHRSNEQHCDTKKGEQELKKIDLLSDIQNNITYIKKHNFIEITSSDSAIKEDIETLNLNINQLKRNRRELYDSVISKLKTKGFRVSEIKKVLEYYKNRHNGKYEPYCEVIVYFLTKKLKAIS